MNFHAIICTVLIINKNFQVEFESEGLQSQKISYYDNKKTVDLLLNVSCQLMDLLLLLKSFKTQGQGLCLIIAFNIQISHLGLPTN